MLFPLKQPAVLWLFGLLFCLQISAQNRPGNRIKTGETGSFPLQNYTSRIYNALPQNWALLQDRRGVMYIGNNQGVLEYDGVHWRLISVANETNVRTLCMDSTGRIYVGAFDEFGYLLPDESGKMQYKSLVQHVPKDDRGFGDVWISVAAKDGIYFQSSGRIFRWDGQNIRSWKAETSFHRMYLVNGHIFVRQREIGLQELFNETIISFKGGEVFKDESIDGMLPFGVKASGAPSDNILICTRKQGLFVMKPSPREMVDRGGPPYILEKFKTQVDPFLFNNIAYHLLKNGPLYSIATATKGNVILDPDGNLVSYLDKNNGLQDESIFSQFADASGNLWLATSNGLSKTNLNSPVTKFSDQTGLNGTVQDVIRHNGSLFAATSLGVFRLQHGYIEDGERFSDASFEKLAGINEECWDLLSFHSGSHSMLLLVTSASVSLIDDQFSKKEILACKPWSIYQSRSDSMRIYIGLENGLASIYWNGSQWQKEVNPEVITESIQTIREDKDGTIWLGHTQGLLRLNFNKPGFRREIRAGDYTLAKYDTTHGLAEGDVKPFEVEGRIIFGTSEGIFTYDGKKFTPNSFLGDVFASGTHQIHRMAPDPVSGNIWMETYITKTGKFDFGYLQKENDGKYHWVTRPFLPYTDEIMHSIYHDRDGVTWFGGASGLYRFDSQRFNNDSLKFHALIRKVIIGKDSALFNGTFFDSLGTSVLTQNASLVMDLPFSLNSMIFEFSAPNFLNERFDMYQYYLEGFDEEWSSWKPETKAVYTNLPEGNYRFMVRARNMFGQESSQAVYEFTILPPWYRTWWAYVLYVLASIGFIYAVVTYATRGLKAIIRERTAEIVKQKEEIEYQNRNITDSINYAKRIQEAILPPYEIMRSRFPESFILYQPKDIVAGDFYWFSEKDRKFMVAACDCTGHGVPGAFMSLICHSLINEVVMEKSISEPNKVLDELKKGIIKSLGQKGQEGEQKDGMDMALVSLEVIIEDKKPVHKLAYAGANNSLYMVRKGELIELNADKMPIGIYMGMERPFSKKEMILEPGDTIYLFTDGYADQFGGDQGKKFTKKRFKDKLIQIQGESLKTQRETLKQTLIGWAGSQQQVDDVLVIGIRIP